MRGLGTAADVLLIVIAYVASVWILSKYTDLHSEAASSLQLLLMVAGAQTLALWYYGAFRCSRRYSGIPDLLSITYALGTGCVAVYVAARLVHDSGTLPADLIIVDAVIAGALLVVSHFGLRVYESERSRLQKDSRRIVIVGAGDGGASILRQLLADPNSHAQPVAIVDDDPKKIGSSICGVPVACGLARLRRLVLETHASEVLICIPSANPNQMRRILEACRESGVPVRTLPDLNNLVDNSASLRDLQHIQIEDLLRRERISPDPNLTRRLLKGKIVLVTGAGGSIGSELCLQIAAAEPKRLILIDKSENSLFYSHLAISEKCPAVDAVPCLLDVTDLEALRTVFHRERPSLVFHAAAFKHVGMMQLHPQEAIRNNVLGTRNVATLAAEFGVQRFVNVSTDKAVNPSCYMGLSKKLAELVVKRIGKAHKAAFLNVRFGNVAGSSGSVLRLFKDQIKKGGPIRITDPRATRFFMSIPEAVYLILCAASRGAAGETYIFDMGEPINIYQLARTISLFSGLAPGEEVPIEFIGMRNGEKVHEELWEPWESPQATENPYLFVLKGQSPISLDIAKTVEEFEASLTARDYDQLTTHIDECLPNFARNRTPKLEEHDYTALREATAEMIS